MRKKYFGHGNFYCWHCGRRQIVGRYLCPHCGAAYNNPEKALVKYTVKPKTGLGIFHPSVLRAQLQYFVFSILFGLAWSVVIMYWAGNVTDWRVYALIWGFWLVWLIWHALHTARKISASRAQNRQPDRQSVHCGCCGSDSHVLTNYCPNCGSIILKPSTEEYLTVNPGMNTVGISPTHTKDGKRRKKKKRDWGMTIFWILLTAGIIYGTYVIGHS